MYNYKIFGLFISSALKCPELPIAQSGNDVSITFGKVPDKIPGATHPKPWFSAKPGKLRLQIDDVANFLVEDGNQIIIEALCEDEDSIRLFLLGSAFAGILLQRNMLLLHASAIKFGEGCSLFLGRSGSGKSTMAAAMQKRGYPILSDDISAIYFDENGQAMVVPGYPQMKLWLDSLEALELNPSQYKKVRQSEPKRAVPIKSSFFDKPLPVSRIYFLQPSDITEVKLSTLSGLKKMELLRQFTYRKAYLEALGKKVVHFQSAVKLLRQVATILIERPENDLSQMDDFFNLVEKDNMVQG